MSYNTVQEALDRALAEKQKYQDNLVGKTFAYAYINKSNNTLTFREVEFKGENYLHLTGLDYKNVQYQKRVFGIEKPTNANEFYERLGTDSTLINDVSFITEATPEQTKRTFDHTQDKLDNLAQLVNIAKKAEYIGRYKDPDSYDLIINRNNVSLAHIKIGSVYIPTSSRYGNARSSMASNDINPVLAIFSKENGLSKYRLDYLSKKAKISKGLTINPEDLHKFNFSSFIPQGFEVNSQQQAQLSAVFKKSLEYSLSRQIARLSNLRENVYSSEKAMTEYLNALKYFINGLGDKDISDVAIALLRKTINEDTPEETKSSIMEEISRIKAKYATYGGNIHILKYDNSDILPDKNGAAAVPAPSDVIGGIKNILDNIISKIRSVLPKEHHENKSTAKKPKQPHSHSQKVKKGKSVQTSKGTVLPKESEKKKEPMFCAADLKSEEYAPRSSKDKSIEKTHKNDLDL